MEPKSLYSSFDSREKSIYISLLRSFILTSSEVKHFMPDSNVYDVSSDDYQINIFLSPNFDVEDGPNIWNPKSGFRLMVTPYTGEYSAHLISHCREVGPHMEWENFSDSWWELSKDKSSTHVDLWTGDLLEDVKIWASAVRMCISYYREFNDERKSEGRSSA